VIRHIFTFTPFGQSTRRAFFSLMPIFKTYFTPYNQSDPFFQDRFYLGPFLPGPFLPDPFYRKFQESLTLQQFKIIQGHRSGCQWKAYM